MMKNSPVTPRCIGRCVWRLRFDSGDYFTRSSGNSELAAGQERQERGRFLRGGGFGVNVARLTKWEMTLRNWKMRTGKTEFENQNGGAECSRHFAVLMPSFKFPISSFEF